jgi:hypothetical protein
MDSDNHEIFVVFGLPAKDYNALENSAAGT